MDVLNVLKYYAQIQNERYTTKTCSCCGNYNKNVKKEKKIKCESCKKEYDRDTNGAKKYIFKKYKRYVS